ncbi:hypothetical protein D3C81_1421410 [compost metagenome]
MTKHVRMTKLLEPLNGSSIVNITTATTLPLAGGKDNPMKDRVKKVTEGTSVMVFQNKKTNGYAAMVQRRLNKEGKNVEFTLSPRKWGTRVPNMPIVEHGDEKYLEVIVLKPGYVYYELDGKLISPAAIQGMKPEPPKAEQGGLDDKVIIKAYNFDSIRAMTINKEQHIFED